MHSVTDNSSSQPQTVFHLASTGTMRPEPGTALPRRANDLPAFYYWKDAIVVGSYVHPTAQFSLDITRDRLDGYVANFNRMKENGVSVPILMDHHATAAATLGWIVDVKREGDQLLELHQFLGESARDIGLRNKVSLGIDPHFVDGLGNQYGEAIVHSAVTPVPVVPDQGGFVAMELSLGVKKKVGVARPGLPSSDAENAVEGSGALHSTVMMKRDLALSRGGVTPEVAHELYDLLVGSNASWTLSRTGAGVPIAMAVFDALARNRPVELGESTGLQVLSRVVPGDEGSLDDLRQRMIALASGARPAGNHF